MPIGFVQLASFCQVPDLPARMLNTASACFAIFLELLHIYFNRVVDGSALLTPLLLSGDAPRRCVLPEVYIAPSDLTAQHLGE